MNYIDFENAIRAILLIRLKINQWDAAKLMSDKASDLQRQFHEGWAPVESAGFLVGKELPEYFGAPDGSNTFGVV